MSTDAELLQRYAHQNSEAAFAELVQRHLSLVYSAALRQVGGDVHLAQDVTQTVFTALARKAASLSGRTALAGWLYLGAHHAAAQAVRGEQRRQVREQEAHTMQELTSSSASTTDWDRVRPVLDEALRELSEPDREAVLLRYFERRPFGDIGAALNVSEDAARMRVERALGKLHGLLSRHGITSTSAALATVLGNQAMVAAPAGLLAGVTGTALAGAAAGSGGVTAAAFFFMKTKTVVMAAVALLGIGFAIYEFNAMRRERENAARLASERDRLKAQLGELRASVAGADERNAVLQRELETARIAKVTTARAPTQAAAPATDIASPTVVTTGGFYLRPSPADPEEARRKDRLNQGQNLDTAYSSFYRQLNLSPAQQEQFRNLMLDRAEAVGQLWGAAVKAARAQNPNFDRADQFEVLQAVRAQTETDQQADVRRMFGDAAAQTLERYQATLPVRHVANQLASALFNSDTPLTPVQADQLVEILAANARGPIGRVDLTTLNIESAAAQAVGLLNAAQIAELRRIAVNAQEQAKDELARNTAPMASLRAAGK